MLLFVSLLGKLLAQPVASELSKSQELLRLCLHWRDIASQDTNVVLRLQHATMASTFLNAACVLSTNAELERASGMDVGNLAKTLEQMIADTRDLLNVRKAKQEPYTNDGDVRLPRARATP